MELGDGCWVFEGLGLLLTSVILFIKSGTRGTFRQKSGILVGMYQHHFCGNHLPFSRCDFTKSLTR